MKPIRMVIFDKDGTLMDFDAFWVTVSRAAVPDILQSLALDIKIFSEEGQEVNLNDEEEEMRREAEAERLEEAGEETFDAESLMDASATATDDDFGDFDLTSFPELDDLDLSDGASAGLGDLDIDI